MGDEKTEVNILVTGGSGFLGRALTHRLADSGYKVGAVSRSPSDMVHPNIENIQADITKPDTLPENLNGCDVVFHTAAKAGIWGNYNSYYRTNVDGTRNIIDLCHRYGIPKLILTGSPSAVYQPGDNEGINERSPYPAKYLCAYSKSKAIAERLVLEADNNGISTLSLRPHLIWGPGDQHLIRRILHRRKQGKLRRIGPYNKKIDTIFIENAVDAHIIAYHRLSESSEISGKSYFVSDDSPIPLWDMIDRICESGGLPPVEQHMSLPTARITAIVSEWIYKLLNLDGEPLLTRFLVNELITAHWFDTSAAKQELGYKPSVSIDEGFEKLQKWLREEGLKKYGI